MKYCLVMIYIKEHVSDSEEIKKRFNVPMEIVCDTQTNDLIHNGFYVYNKLLLYNILSERAHIKNQITLHVFNLCSKEDIINISYPRTDNYIYGYLDGSISPTQVQYVIKIHKEINHKDNQKSKIKGVVL